MSAETPITKENLMYFRNNKAEAGCTIFAPSLIIGTYRLRRSVMDGIRLQNISVIRFNTGRFETPQTT